MGGVLLEMFRERCVLHAAPPAAPPQLRQLPTGDPGLSEAEPPVRPRALAVFLTQWTRD